jgi:two-component system response regulator HydG
MTLLSCLQLPMQVLRSRRTECARDEGLASPGKDCSTISKAIHSVWAVHLLDHGPTHGDERRMTTPTQMAQKQPPKISSRLLIVDDDDEMREALQVVLAAAGHTCVLAADAAAALEILGRETIDVVISDIRMQGMNGLELLDHVRQKNLAVPFIAITGTGGIHEAVDAIRRGAFDYLVKPCDGDEVRRIVASALEGRSPPGERARLSALPGVGNVELVGSAPAMQKLQAAIGFVARSNAPVLITGETGVGKELVARAIHAQSARRTKPLVVVNTSAIPQELLESEIFGHTRGAFTGAVQPRKGLLSEADGGTLLLDEIGDMPVGLQAKLLRVLQFGEVRPLGSDRAHQVDVRIMAATHCDLPALVKEGRFREDLYYRLNVLPVPVPPLRERREDIPALAAYFLAAARKRCPTSPARSIGQDALRLLTEASWPGNIRELESCIERAVVFGVDPTIEARHLSLVPNAAPPEGWGFAGREPCTLRELSRAYTEWVLKGTGGNKERAAAILGINLSTLYRWMRTEGHVDWTPPSSSPGTRAEGVSASAAEASPTEHSH